MKRLNPKTNAPFKRGDVREDGRVFYNYTNTTRGDGYFVERWVRAETLAKTKAYDKDRKAKSLVRKSDRLPKGYKDICNHDPEIIAVFKNAWRAKTEGADKDDLLWMIDIYDELIDYFFPEEAEEIKRQLNAEV